MSRLKYKYKTKPYEHQVEALKKLISTGFGGALLMEPRTGKTKVCVDYASAVHTAGKCDRVLVLCPVSVMDTWVHEIQTHCPVKHRITVWDRKGRKRVMLPKLGQGVLDFVIMNYEAFSAPGAIIGRDEHGNIKRSKSRGGRFDIKKKIKAWKPDMLICDESHRLKSPSARKSTTIFSTFWSQPKGLEHFVTHTPYRVLASGTAVTKRKRLYDVYQQWRILNPEAELVAGYTSGEFKQEYARWTSRNGYQQWVRPKNEARFHRLLHEHAYSVTRDECFDLPPAFPPELIPIPLEESAKVYDEMAEEMVAQIQSGEITEASIKLVLNMRLLQITSGLAKTSPSERYPEGRLVRIGREKLRMLEDRLVDWFDQDEKIVVCARFRGDISGIAALAKKLKVQPQILIGGMTRQERTSHINAFNRKSGPGIFIMNPQAGALGIDLRTAATMVWFSLTASYVDYTQARDRIALSDRAVRHVYLLGEGTYDELLYEGLQEDHDVVKTLMKNPDKLLRNP